MSSRVAFRTVPVLALLAVATVAVLAQGQSAPQQSQMYTMTVVTVHPGMGPEYVAFQKDEVMPAQQKGGMKVRMAYSSGVFGEPGTFAFFSPIENFAQFDGPSPIMKALGEQAAAQLGAKAAKLTPTRRVMLVRSRPELAYQAGASASPAPLALVSEVEVAAGRRGDFEALIRNEVLPIMQKAKVTSYSVTEVIYGGTAGTYYTAIGYPNYEAVGKGHPFQVILGEEGTKTLESKFTGIVTRLERYVVRYREDLSFRPAPGTN